MPPCVALAQRSRATDGGFWPACAWCVGDSSLVKEVLLNHGLLGVVGDVLGARKDVAGHNGLVGSAVVRQLKKKGFKKLILIEKKKLDLRNFEKVSNYFKNKKIDYMVMAAARAGGIIANSTNQMNFFLENIEIQNSLLQLALKKKIKRTIYLGTSCIYPKFSKVPILEESLLTGKLEKTNQCYAIAKISGIKLCDWPKGQPGQFTRGC